MLSNQRVDDARPLVRQREQGRLLAFLTELASELGLELFLESKAKGGKQATLSVGSLVIDVMVDGGGRVEHVTCGYVRVEDTSGPEMMEKAATNERLVGFLRNHRFADFRALVILLAELPHLTTQMQMGGDVPDTLDLVHMKTLLDASLVEAGRAEAAAAVPTEGPLVDVLNALPEGMRDAPSLLGHGTIMPTAEPGKDSGNGGPLLRYAAHPLARLGASEADGGVWYEAGVGLETAISRRFHTFYTAAPYLRGDAPAAAPADDSGSALLPAGFFVDEYVHAAAAAPPPCMLTHSSCRPTSGLLLPACYYLLLSPHVVMPAARAARLTALGAREPVVPAPVASETDDIADVGSGNIVAEALALAPLLLGGKAKASSYRATHVFDSSVHHYALVQEVTDKSPGGATAVRVSRVPFVHPTRLFAQLQMLRQQITYNTLLESCFRPTGKADPDVVASATPLSFEIGTRETADDPVLLVSYWDTERDVPASLEVTVHAGGRVSCSLAGSDSSAEALRAARILQVTHSVPLAMSRVFASEANSEPPQKRRRR